MQSIPVLKLESRFKWEQVSGNPASLLREVTLPDINRPGLELTGYFYGREARRLIVLGHKEIGYINTQMDEIAQREAFEYITSPETPCIVISWGQECPPILQEIADRKNFPIFVAQAKTSDLILAITTYLDEKLAPSEVIHAELVQIYGIGVLISGASGVGKSEIVLELVKRGHQLVADDRVDIYRIHNSLIGRTAQLIEGFMELRGVGIIDVKRMYGITSVAPSTQIYMEIELIPRQENSELDRLGLNEKPHASYLGIDIMKMIIPVSYGRPMATVIESAVTNYLLLRDGFDSAREFEERVLQEIEKNRL